MTGNNNLLNTVYCNEQDSNLCNDFTNNAFIIIFYILYLVYLYFSSVQIRLGYYDIRRKSLFKRRMGLKAKERTPRRRNAKSNIS